MLRESDLTALPEKNEAEVDRLVQSLGNKIDEIQASSKNEKEASDSNPTNELEQGEENV